MAEKALRIGIIGGGFCGALTAVHLLRSQHPETTIVLFEPATEPGKGIAYAPYSTQHLLNVKAKSMSAFPDDPEHFVRWLLDNTEVKGTRMETIAESYQPRSVYGAYIASIFSEESRKHPGRIRLVQQRVVDFRKSGTIHLLTAADGTQYPVDRTVLATGNFLPGKPKGIPHSFTSSPLYFKDPWAQIAVSGYDSALPVLIAGTGLTMVDVVIGLREAGYPGTVVALSPKGYSILSHQEYEPQPQILESLHPPYRLEEVFKLFRQHIREVRSKGISGESVVDAVRLRTTEIWSSFTAEEKRRFIAHLRHLWGLARHRLPKSVHTGIQTEIDRGSLKIKPGRILDIHEENGAATVTFYNRDTGGIEQMTVGRVINCTGPQTDIKRLDDPLFKSLLLGGHIVSDAMDMGVQCDEDGHPIGTDTVPDSSLIVIGSLLKGDRWESTAVPELRKQAQAAAKKLLEQNIRP